MPEFLNILVLFYIPLLYDLLIECLKAFNSVCGIFTKFQTLLNKPLFLLQGLSKEIQPRSLQYRSLSEQSNVSLLFLVAQEKTRN